MEDEEEYGLGRQPYMVKPLGKLIKLYLVGSIGPAANYIEWFEEIRSAGEHDTIVIHINSEGGNLFTAIQFMRCMAECRGTIIASVEGMCMSAATVIFLSAGAFEISKHSRFLFHNYRMAMGGKGGELYDQVSSDKEWSSELWSEIYKGILTPAEIAAMVDGKDFWMSDVEVLKRLQKRHEQPKKKRVKKVTSKE